ncbi:ppdK, partial [Symbiodinium sp. CCMP2456]
MCLQEADINEASGATWSAAWQAKGCHTFLGTVGDQSMYTTTIVSTIPGRLVRLDVTDPSRVTATVFEFFTEGEYEKIVIVSLYNYFADKEAAGAFLEEVVTALETIGLKWIVLGDFNLTQDDGPMARRLASGLCRSLDEPFLTEGPLPGTAGGARRLDFGVSSRSVTAASVWHAPGIADHTAVAYSFCFADPGGFSSPMRTSLSTAVVDPAAWLSAWDQERFRELLLATDFDGAWRLISDTAERVLSPGDGGRGFPRAGQWAPRGRAQRSKAASAFEPLPMVRLRRFGRRLGQLVRQPGDRRLRDIMERDLEYLDGHFGWLAELPLLGIERHAQWVNDKIEAEAKSIREAGFERWRGAMHNSLPKQAAWIKTSVHTRGSGFASRTAIHPCAVIEEAEQQWVDRWTMGNVDTTPVASLLQRLPPVDSVSTLVQFTASKLRQACTRMRHKSPGPDDWSAEHYLALPDPFWEALAQLWQCCYQSAAVPRRWREAKVTKVCMIPKASGGHRPIAVLALGYRLGASVLARELRSWTEQWTGHRLMGGFHKRSCRDVFLRILHATEDRGMAFVGEDISKFFDSLVSPHVRLVLQHLKAPSRFVDFACSVMAEQWRVFTSGGFLGEKWHRTDKGAAQGDPLSPLIAGAVMWVWTTSVACSGTEAVAFVDDRSFWSPCAEALSEAKRRSAAVDAAFGFTCDARKCQLSVGPACNGSALAGAFGYELKDHLELLGVRIPVPRGDPPRLARFTFDLAQARVVCSNAVAKGMWQRGFHYKTLVLPMMVWAGAIASIPCDEVTRLANAILSVTNYRHACDTPAIVVWEVLGWECCPSFARRWAALRDAVALTCKPPVWLEEAELTFAAKRWPTLLPVASEVLGELGWWTDRLGTVIQRRDSLGHLRSFELGVDSTDVLAEWLRDWHRARALASTNRVAASLHRGDPSLARGALLPGVPCGSLVLLRGHKEAYASAGNRTQRNSALATGCSVWAKAAKQGIAVSLMCEERLLARTVPELPAPPPVVGRDYVVEALAYELDALFADNVTVHVGTDGSSVSEVGAWAVAVQDGEVYACGVSSEDQTPYRAEVEGLRAVLEALLLCRRCGSVVVVCDCQAALWALDGHGRAGVLVQR